MAAFKAFGSWLEDSEWTSVLVNAQVTSPGTADSFLKASPVTTTRRTHQVTACTLYRLLSNAYCQYKDVLRYDESIREANFLLYIEALSKIIPWFFALDHTNYSRWLPIRLRDMLQLPKKNPETHKAILSGNPFCHQDRERNFPVWLLIKPTNKNNAYVKADGGAVGLTENPGVLHRWMVAGPEMASLVNEFENVTECFVYTNESYKPHHEQILSFQESFQTDCRLNSCG
ncbi:Hypothetical predicted protein [Mytilus galloprovincialis]|nr:Hypothetical predicted protein [Mytilus galloprovincialis]